MFAHRLERAGKTGLSRDMHWLVPSDHPDAITGEQPSFERAGDEDVHHVIASPDDIVVVVAGASNAGVSTVIDLMGSSGSRGGQSGRVPAMGIIHATSGPDASRSVPSARRRSGPHGVKPPVLP